MGHVIQLPSSQRPRGDIPACGAQILLFTGVWRERYDTTPAELLRTKNWGGAKERLVKSAKASRAKLKGCDAPKGPKAPTRGRKRA